MTKSQEPGNIIYFNPQNLREFIFKKVLDHRIATMNTVELIGRRSNRSLITVIYWVDGQREVYVFGRNVKWLRKYTQ